MGWAIAEEAEVKGSSDKWCGARASIDEGDQWGGEDAGIAATLNSPGRVKVAAEEVEDIRVESEAGILDRARKVNRTRAGLAGKWGGSGGL